MSQVPAGRIDDGPVDVSAVDTEPQAWSSQRGHGREARRPRLLPPGPVRLPLRGPEVLVRRRLRPTWTEHTSTWSTTIAGAAMSGALHGLKSADSNIV